MNRYEVGQRVKLVGFTNAVLKPHNGQVATVKGFKLYPGNVVKYILKFDNVDTLCSVGNTVVEDHLEEWEPTPQEEKEEKTVLNTLCDNVRKYGWEHHAQFITYRHGNNPVKRLLDKGLVTLHTSRVQSFYEEGIHQYRYHYMVALPNDNS